MGLNTDYDCWNGSYSGFNRFRYSLAKQVGIDLSEYDGYGKGGEKCLSDIEHDLMPLFNHSDCDGTLTVNDSKRIVKGFNNVLENFNENLGFDFDFKDNIIIFRDGCLEAIEENENIDFY